MKWTGEITVRRQGKSYIMPPVFVTVDAGNYAAALGAAAREGRKRIGGLHPGIRIEAASVKVERVKEAGNGDSEE